MFACLFLVDFSIAQNLINTGQINNSGTFRVKQQAIGLPDSIDGVFDFFGADQVIPARHYRHLRATGTGIKISQGGNFVVSGDVTIGQAVVIVPFIVPSMRMEAAGKGWLVSESTTLPLTVKICWENNIEQQKNRDKMINLYMIPYTITISKIKNIKTHLI